MALMMDLTTKINFAREDIIMKNLQKFEVVTEGQLIETVGGHRHNDAYDAGYETGRIAKAVDDALKIWNDFHHRG